MIIYKATNKINGKIYIGQTVQPLHKRWKDHCRGDKQPEGYLHRAIVKYGAESFTIEQIDSAETLEELNIKEETYIKALNCLSPNGYNLLPGGGNREVHPETQEKIRQKLKGRPISNRWAKGRSHPHSEETKAKLSAIFKGKLIKNRWTGGNPNPPSEEHKAKMSAMWKGKPNTVLYKKVLCSNGMEFESVNAAAKHFNLNRVTISGLLKSGKIGRCGFSFKFL